MTSELYTAASGLITEQRRLELISNNLANGSTAGYRSQRLFSAAYQRATTEADARASNVAVAVGGAWEPPGGGPLRPTGRSLDVALDDGVLLAVQTPAGRRYTRRGDLQVSPEGRLLGGSGNPVLDAKGKPIKGLGAGATIGGDGAVFDLGNEVGRLMFVRDSKGVLRRDGSGLLTAGERDGSLQKVKTARIRSGWLEGSATDVLGEMVRLIETQRAFESYQKLISLTMNEVNRRAVNDLAR